jgi:ketosteroid isomerase-like protein
MSAPTPAVVSRYLAAAERSDFAELADCFTPDGFVVDEGVTYRGRDEIVGWREAVAGKWVYTTVVTGSEPLGPNQYRVQVRVEGNFPGGVADLTYRFVLHGGAIAELSIVE